MMQSWSCVEDGDWTSSSAYLPLAGLTLVLVYIWHKRKKRDWLKRMCVFGLLFMSCPVLSSMFTLFTDYYSRWYYMPLLLFALASARVLENLREYPVRRGAVLMTVGYILLWAGFAWWDRYRYPVIYHVTAYRLISGTAVLGAALLCILPQLSARYVSRIGICLIGAFAVCTTSYTVFLYQQARGQDAEEYQYKVEACEKLGKLLEMEKEPWRMSSTDNVTAAFAQISPAGSTFNTVEGSVFSLWEALGESRRVVCPPIPEGFYELVGVKWKITSDLVGRAGYRLLGKEETPSATYYLYETDGKRTIGATYEAYIPQEDFEQLEPEERVTAMLNAVVIPEEEPRFREILRIWDGREEVHENIQAFSRDARGFTCTVQSRSPQAVLFSIPYAAGWRAYRNGTEVPILETNGLMMIMTEAGENRITFAYLNRTAVLGMMIGAVSILGWIVFYGKEIKSRKKGETDHGKTCDSRWKAGQEHEAVLRASVYR